jgi:hypothetical protein
MKSNQLAKQTVNYQWVPEVATKLFESYMEDWYIELAATDRCPEDLVPLITNNMMFKDELTRDILLDHYTDIYNHHYLKEANVKFDPNQFPHNWVYQDDHHWEQSRKFLEKNETVIELRFIEDMKRYLYHNKMFFQESYSIHGFSVNPVFRNFPVGKVW